MKPMVLAGIVLIALGVVGLAVDNISFTQQRTVIDAGPLKVTASEQKSIPIPTIAGVIAVVAGLGLCVMGARKSA